MTAFSISAPASTSNLGPAFDALGLALDFGLTVHAEIDSRFEVNVDSTGEDAQALPKDRRNLIAATALERLAEAGAESVGLRLRVVNEIPVARGLGASAAARVAGLLLASAILSQREGRTWSEDPEDILSRAARAEGHPDNAAPCVLGGLVATVAEESGTRSIRLPVGSDLRLALFIPDEAMSTTRVRAALPSMVPFSDASFNVGRVALLVAALAMSDFGALDAATRDRLHQPTRLGLIDGWANVLDAARDAGAYGSFVSGAGSTTAAFCAPATADVVARSMADAAERAGISGRTRISAVATRGASVRVADG